MKVNGKIWSHEVEVKLTDWWDEVLSENYKLMPLNRLESYINTNKHLPDIPTEKEVSIFRYVTAGPISTLEN